MSDVHVTIEHVRKAHLCVKGARAWFDHHGLDFRDFLQNGCSSSVLEATHDALGLKAVAEARKAQEES